MTNNLKHLLYSSFILFTLISSSLLFAEGSKDLYPVGAHGGRATLRSGTDNTYGTSKHSWPFPTNGDHFVYVRKGETIAMASSIQGFTNASNYRNLIKLYDPNGNAISLSSSSGSTTYGNIANRKKELQGPLLPGASGSDGYRAIYYEAKNDGIYRVEFLVTTKQWDDSKRTNVLADANWTQHSDQPFIMAWDISVANVTKSSWLSGRVYANVLNMEISTIGHKPYNGGFYGKLKVLTDDGYQYNVDNNGQNGIFFSFMVNNIGFHPLNHPGTSLYKSVPQSDYEYISKHYHDPRKADGAENVTHKIFYNTPDYGMPEKAIGGPKPGEETWLNTIRKSLQITDFEFKGAEGTTNQMARSKGGYISFHASIARNYKISIKPSNGANFAERILTGFATVGMNHVQWDGKDGNDNFLPAGDQNIEVNIEVPLGEVHFPYIDVELNPNGIIIELLDNDGNILDDKVYWDDTDIPNVSNTASYGTNSSPKLNNHIVSPDGISSNSNGHQWGMGYNAATAPVYAPNTFGDTRGMDTWTFLKATANVSTIIKINEADLEVTTVSANPLEYTVGQPVDLHIKIKNYGPSIAENSKFTFELPMGFSDNNNVAFSGNSCGAQISNLTYNNASRTYSSVLDLAANCEVTYTISAMAANMANQSSAFKAAILRPRDNTDPDATNSAQGTYTNPYNPTDAEVECNNNGLGGNCNNIKLIRINRNPICYKDPNLTGNGSDTKIGITLLNRAGSKNGNWPMIRKSGFIALESNTKGFVPTRLTNTQMNAIPVGDRVEGMMFYNSDEHCLMIYTGSDWKCFNQPSCQ